MRQVCMMILCFILFDLITNGTSSSKSDSNNQEISSSSSSSSTTAVGDAYTLLNKIKTSCEMNSMVVGSKLIDYYNSYDEHTDRYIRMTNDYFMRQLGFAYWLQSSYMYNHLLSSSSSPSSMQQPHYNVKDRFHEITAIQKQNGWNYEYMTLLVTSDHEGNHHHHHHGAESSSSDGDIVIASASSSYETSISTSIPAADTSTATVTTTSTTTGALEKTVGYQYNSLRDKWIYFLGDSTLHQLFHTFLRVDHGM